MRDKKILAAILAGLLFITILLVSIVAPYKFSAKDSFPTVLQAREAFLNYASPELAPYNARIVAIGCAPTNNDGSKLVKEGETAIFGCAALIVGENGTKECGLFLFELKKKEDIPAIIGSQQAKLSFCQ